MILNKDDKPISFFLSFSPPFFLFSSMAADRIFYHLHTMQSQCTCFTNLQAKIFQAIIKQVSWRGKIKTS